MRGDVKLIDGEEKLMEGAVAENRSGAVCGGSSAHGLPADRANARAANGRMRAVIGQVRP